MKTWFQAFTFKCNWYRYTSAGGHTYVAQTPANTAEWEENMGVLEEYTFLKSEREVLAELDKIDTATGTRIVLFNLKAGLYSC